MECGHCGCSFPVEGVPAPRSVKCPVCGGVSAVIVVASPPPPKPIWIPAPVPRPAPPAPKPTSASLGLDDLHPEDRALYLTSQWASVYSALSNARGAANGVKSCLAMFLIVAHMAAVMRPARRAGEAGELETCSAVCVGIVLFIPAFIHIINQIICTAVPRSHGGRLVTVSLVLLPFILCVFGAAAANSNLATALTVAGIAAAVVSFGCWLQFLARLGESLGSRGLRNEARSFMPWYWAGTLLAIAMASIPFSFPNAERGPFVSCGVSGAGIIWFWLAHQYSWVLKRATGAVGRFAPVTFR